MESMFEGAAFDLRRRIFGRIVLRPGLPRPQTDERVQRENGFYRLVLERLLPADEALGVSTVVDVGCRNWSYAPAMARHFSSAKLLGVEVDGWRRYFNLYRRLDQALANAQAVGAECFFGDFRDLRGLPGDEGPVAFTFFYPFVSENPCRKWGLPASRFADFSALLAHARTLAGAREFRVLSVHQGKWEAARAREAYAAQGLDVRESVLAVDEFRGLWPSGHDAYLFDAALKL